MRGKGMYFRIIILRLGITPAHAGKRGCKSVLLQADGDHPRACGEKGLKYIDFSCSSGSPPRMRGKEGQETSIDVVRGITPAHAGKSYNGLVCAACAWDHPRACGEKAKVGRSKWFAAGSPPRMRGKACPGSGQGAGQGITPAHAGKSFFSLPACGLSWDHPRACGEKDDLLSCSGFFRGSPPRMRGKAIQHQMGRTGTGITPAHAGKRDLPL